MNNMEIKEFALDLATAESEDEVINILKSKGFWDDPSAWRDYGDRENNFSEIGNQSEAADAALTEKLTNCADSILIAECLEKGIKPEAEEAPDSISDALTKFFSIKEGVLAYLSESERITLSKNIGLVATGSKQTPSLIVFDKGMGQAPSEFPDTFLSLGKSNKIRIGFVQGKFNMGSTGSLLFCGERNIQLIISKKRPSLSKDILDGELWGVTVVRKDPPLGQMKSSVFRYLAPQNEVLKFSSDELQILPADGDTSSPYVSNLEYGSFVKLYDYEFGSRYRTNILFDLFNRLNLLLPGAYLPVRFYERRQYSGHSLETTLSGLTTRIEIEKGNLESGLAGAGASINVSGQKLPVQIYAFKKKDGKSLKGNYASNEGVVFTINGQAHGFLNKDFFARKACGMAYLDDSLLLIVDCNNISGQTRERLFMNSRDRLRTGLLKNELEAELEALVSNHSGLKDLRESRKRQMIEEKLQDDKPLSEILEKVLKDSPALSDLLLKGIKLKNPFHSNLHEDTEEYLGQRFPSFYEPIRYYDKENPREAELGRKVRLQFKTDAENTYFSRAIEPGVFRFFLNDKETHAPENLWNGKHTINFTIPESTEVNDIVCVRVEVSDDTRPTPFTHELYIKVIPFHIHEPSPPKPKPNPPSDKPGNQIIDSEFNDLPNIIPVESKDWDYHGFDKYSGLKAIFDGEKYDFYYNSDNAYLKQEQKTIKDAKSEIVETQYKTALALIGMSILVDDSIDDEIREAQIFSTTRALSPIILPLINSLGDINID